MDMDLKILELTDLTDPKVLKTMGTPDIIKDLEKLQELKADSGDNRDAILDKMASIRDKLNDALHKKGGPDATFMYVTYDDKNSTPTRGFRAGKDDTTVSQGGQTLNLNELTEALKIAPAGRVSVGPIQILEGPGP